MFQKFKLLDKLIHNPPFHCVELVIILQLLNNINVIKPDIKLTTKLINQTTKSKYLNKKNVIRIITVQKCG